MSDNSQNTNVQNGASMAWQIIGRLIDRKSTRLNSSHS